MDGFTHLAVTHTIQKNFHMHFIEFMNVKVMGKIEVTSSTWNKVHKNKGRRMIHIHAFGV